MRSGLARSTLGIAMRSGGAATPFDPLSVFAGGANAGFYHDFTRGFSVLSSGVYPLYQDDYGDRVTADGQSVAQAIDRSQGAALTEVWDDPTPTITSAGDNGSYDDASNTMSNSTISANATYPRFSFDLGLDTSKTYWIEGRLDGDRTSVLDIWLGAIAGSASYNSTTGVFTAVGKPAAADNLIIRTNGTTAFDIQIAEMSVQEIAGNHGLQATGSAKPTYRTPGLVRGDGVDDNLLTTLMPATSMTLVEVGTPDSGSASDVIMGAQPASNGRAYMAITSSGYLGGGVGTQNTSTIVDSTSTDIRGTRCGKAIRWDGSTVSLFLQTDGGAFTQVYSAAQSGAPTTSVAMHMLALNNNGTPASSFDSDTEMMLAVQAALSDAQIKSLFATVL